MGDGGEDEDRTHDLRIANAALSQLSYVPMGEIIAAWEGGVNGARREPLGKEA